MGIFKKSMIASSLLVACSIVSINVGASEYIQSATEVKSNKVDAKVENTTTDIVEVRKINADIQRLKESSAAKSALTKEKEIPHRVVPHRVAVEDFDAADVIHEKISRVFPNETFTVSKVRMDLYVVILKGGDSFYFTNTNGDYLINGAVFDVNEGYVLSDEVKEKIASARRLMAIKNSKQHNNFFGEIHGVETISGQYTGNMMAEQLSHAQTNRLSKVATGVNTHKVSQNTGKVVNQKAPEPTIGELAQTDPASLKVSDSDFRKKCVSISIVKSADLEELFGAFRSMNDEARQICGYFTGEFMLPNLPDEKLTVYRADNEKDVLTVLSDPSCVVCKKLHSDIPSLNKLGYTVRIVPFGRDPYYAPEVKGGFEVLTPVAKSLISAGCLADNEARKKAFDSLSYHPAGISPALYTQSPPSEQCYTQMVYWKNIGNIISSAATPFIASSNTGRHLASYANARWLDHELSNEIVKGNMPVSGH